MLYTKSLEGRWRLTATAQPGSPSLLRVPDEIPRLADLARDVPSPPRRAGTDVKPADLSGVIWVETATERTLTTREGQLQESNKCLLSDLEDEDEDPLAFLRSPVDADSAHWSDSDSASVASPEMPTRSDSLLSIKRSFSSISMPLKTETTASDLDEEPSTPVRAVAKRQRAISSLSMVGNTEHLDQAQDGRCCWGMHQIDLEARLETPISRPQVRAVLVFMICYVVCKHPDYTHIIGS